MLRFARIGFAAVLGWATFIVTVESLDPLQPFRIIAAAAVAVSAVLQLWSVVTGWTGAGQVAVEDIESLMQASIVDMYQNHHLGKDLTQVSAHVWSVPLWYRKIFPYRLRKWLKGRLSQQAQQDHGWRPNLTRLASFQLPKRAPSGISFKKGYGIVGIAIEKNDPTHGYFVNFKSPDYLLAMSAGEAQWDSQATKLTRNLSYTDAARLAQKYGEAVAVVIRKRLTGEPIGCLTLEVSPSSDATIEGNQSLLAAISSLADLVSPVVDRA